MRLADTGAFFVVIFCLYIVTCKLVSFLSFLWWRGVERAWDHLPLYIFVYFPLTFWRMGDNDAHPGCDPLLGIDPSLSGLKITVILTFCFCYSFFNWRCRFNYAINSCIVPTAA